MDKQVIKCFYCENNVSINEPDEKYCCHCGVPLFNECSNYSCKRKLALTDAYCKYCGAPSTFLNLNIIEAAKPIKLIKPASVDGWDDLPF